MASPQNPKPSPNPAIHLQMEGKEEYRNWAELSHDTLVEIFRLVGTMGVFNNAEPVCSSWRKVARNEPGLWRRIDFRNHGFGQEGSEALMSMTKLAVERSKGGLEEFWIEDFGDDGLLQYLCDKTRVLKSLRLISCKQVHDIDILETVKRQPLLEEIEISLGSCCCPNLPEIIGNLLPNLKKFALNGIYASSLFYENDETEAFGIADSMHELRHLQLIGNCVTNEGLKAILEGCPKLETLDIRRCKNVCMDSNLRARCAKLKTFRHPLDSLDDYQLPADMMGYFRSLGVDDSCNPYRCFDMKNHFFFGDDDDEEEEGGEEEDEHDRQEKYIDNILRRNGYFCFSDNDDDDA